MEFRAIANPGASLVEHVLLWEGMKHGNDFGNRNPNIQIIQEQSFCRLDSGKVFSESSSRKGNTRDT
eukprot:scaffold6284_cov85-Cylindrotheca_fusiformis.AAC.1